MQVEKKTWKIYLIFAMMMILSMVAGIRQMQQWLKRSMPSVLKCMYKAAAMRPAKSAAVSL